MTTLVAENELYRSCEILFGLELRLTRDFLEYLQISGVKNAYRQRARETHPDLAVGRSESEQRQSVALFHSVQAAYETLRNYLDAREKGYRLQAQPMAPRPAHHQRSQARPTPRKTPPRAKRQATAQSQKWYENVEELYQGAMPQRKLLFGHFLYYSGAISWRMVVQALVWQRTQRPRIGELGKKVGWLSEKDVRRVLEYRVPQRPFGESAVKLGILQKYQLRSLILQQKRLQKRFGDYFVETNILSRQKMNTYATAYYAHNARMDRAKSQERYHC